jgi:hypothetical protein
MPEVNLKARSRSGYPYFLTYRTRWYIGFVIFVRLSALNLHLFQGATMTNTRI